MTYQKSMDVTGMLFGIIQQYIGVCNFFSVRNSFEIFHFCRQLLLLAKCQHCAWRWFSLPYEFFGARLFEQIVSFSPCCLWLCLLLQIWMPGPFCREDCAGPSWWLFLIEAEILTIRFRKCTLNYVILALNSLTRVSFKIFMLHQDEIPSILCEDFISGDPPDFPEMLWFEGRSCKHG